MRRTLGHWQKKQTESLKKLPRKGQPHGERPGKSQSRFHHRKCGWCLWAVHATSTTFTTNTTTSAGLCMSPVLAALLALQQCASNPGPAFAAGTTGPCASPLAQPPLLLGTLGSGCWSGLARGGLSPPLRPPSSFHILLSLSFSGAVPRPESTALGKAKYWSSRGLPPGGQ